MIMRGGQPLLLPANPVFIWFTLCLALLQDMLPLGRQPWRPDLLALVLVFWTIHQPLRAGVGVAFVFGLFMDVHRAGLLGQHALVYTALSYLAIMVHRRILWFPVSSQALQVLPLLMAAHVLELVVRLISGDGFPSWSFWLAPFLQAMLWPVMSLLLLMPQHRAHDPDENRPL